MTSATFLRETGGGSNPETEAPKRLIAKERRAYGVANYRLLQLATLIFFAPCAIFALSLVFAAQVVILLGCAVSLALVWPLERRNADTLLSTPIEAKTLAICVGLAVALCVLGGEGHFFYPAFDWFVRDSVLADLVKHGFPVAYNYEGQGYLLRAPLGMYMIPAVVGRALGLYAAHLALLAQNAAALSIILYFIACMTKARRYLVLALFIAFSGMDVIPLLAYEAAELMRSGHLFSVIHIERWNNTIQYSSHITQLFWAPNHMLPGWWFAMLALLYTRREIGLHVLIGSFGALQFWSPLAALGAAPFLLYFGVAALPRALLSSRNVFAALGALCFLPLSYYLTLDSGDVPKRFLIGEDGFLGLYVLFLFIEIPHAAIIAAMWNRLDLRDRKPLMLAIAVLVALPIYKLGPSNDFVMRASIAPLFLLAFAFARLTPTILRDRSRLAALVYAVIALSAATPLVEINTALNHAHAISDCNLLTSWRKTDPTNWPSNYLARIERTPSWLVNVGVARVTIEDRKCWPDHALLDDDKK